MEHVINLLPDGPRTYVTSTISLHENDSILIYVQNFSDDLKIARVRIYKNIGPEARTVFDSGDEQILQKGHWAHSHNVSEDNVGDFWLQLDLNSETLIPTVAFEREVFEREVDDRYLPFFSYKPGDFAVFDAQQRRIR